VLLAVSSSAARGLARESQMRQLVGASDGDVLTPAQLREVSSPVADSVHVSQCAQTRPDCAQPPPQTVGVAPKPTQSNVIAEATTVVVERLSWATDELRRSSSIETCCQLCMLIRSCADALQSLQRAV